MGKEDPDIGDIGSVYRPLGSRFDGDVYRP